MPDRFDVVVAGAGHNSLIAAAYLAKAGYRCLVLEGRQVVGGNCVTEELTLPGFQHDSCGTAHVVIQDSPMLRNDELGLGNYGLEYIHPDRRAPFSDGTYLTRGHDLDRTREFGSSQEGCRRVPAHDRRLRRGQTDQRPSPTRRSVGASQSTSASPSRRQAVAARIAMSGWDIIRDNFEDDHCRSFICGWRSRPWYRQNGRCRDGLFASPWPSALELVRAQGGSGTFLPRWPG